VKSILIKKIANTIECKVSLYNFRACFIKRLN